MSSAPESAPLSTDVNGQSLCSAREVYRPENHVLEEPPTSKDTQDGTQPPPSLTGDPTCKSCTTPTSTPYRFDKANKEYLYGDIIKVNESVHAPIDPLFSIVAKVKTGSPTQAIPRGRGKGPRPAVVLSARPIELEIDETYLMLMARYDGICKLAELPSVLQLFCIPVSPHHEIQKGVEHLHTTPEWQKQDVWLLTLPCSSPGKVFGRWKWEDQCGKLQDTHTFHAGEKALFELAEIQKRRWKEWSTKCSTEDGYLQGCHEEYENFKLQGRLQAQSRGYADKASFDSRLTLRTIPESQFASAGQLEQDSGDEHTRMPLSQPLPRNVDVQTTLLELSPPQPPPPTPRRRLVFGTAPYLNLEGVSVAPGIENRLRTILLPSSDFGARASPVLQENPYGTSAASTERTHSEPSRDTTRAGQDSVMLAMPQQEVHGLRNLDASSTMGNNQTVYNSPQGTILQHAPVRPARTKEAGKDHQGPAVGTSAKRSEHKWTDRFFRGGTRRKSK